MVKFQGRKWHVLEKCQWNMSRRDGIGNSRWWLNNFLVEFLNLQNLFGKWHFRIFSNRWQTKRPTSVLQRWIVDLGFEIGFWFGFRLDHLRLGGGFKILLVFTGMTQIDEHIFQMGGSTATYTMLFEGHVYSLGHVHVYTLPLLDVTPNRVFKKRCCQWSPSKIPKFSGLHIHKGSSTMLGNISWDAKPHPRFQ